MADHPPVYNENTVENNDDSPPEYNSLIGQLRKAKNDSSNNADYVRTSAQIICGSTLISICSLFSLLIPIPTLVIGVLYKDQCNVQKNIPIWLIVTGACGTFTALVRAITNLANFIKNRKKDEPKQTGPIKTVFDCFMCCLGIFMIAWFICGSVWVYGNYKNVQYDASDVDKANNYCHKLCYLFSFWSITVSWGFILLSCFCFCCLILVGCGMIPVAVCLGSS